MRWKCDICGKVSEEAEDVFYDDFYELPPDVYLVSKGWRRVMIDYWDREGGLYSFHMTACPDHLDDMYRRTAEFLEKNRVPVIDPQGTRRKWVRICEHCGHEFTTDDEDMRLCTVCEGKEKEIKRRKAKHARWLDEQNDRAPDGPVK